MYLFSKEKRRFQSTSVLPLQQQITMDNQVFSTTPTTHYNGSNLRCWCCCQYLFEAVLVVLLELIFRIRKPHQSRDRHTRFEDFPHRLANHQRFQTSCNCSKSPRPEGFFVVQYSPRKNGFGANDPKQDCTLPFFLCGSGPSH